MGATSFLFTLYKYVGIFMVAFEILIFLLLGSVEGFSTSHQPCTYDQTKMCKPALATALFSSVSFLLDGITSVVSGFLGMKIATYANARTTLEAREGVRKAFIATFRSGAVMGFLFAANGLLVLYIAINLFKICYGDDWGGLFEAINGYSLGGSCIALFGRVGGGIYTKATDVGADLSGKVERNIPKDDPRNPAVIADNVGDNVGDIAGMGSDLFGSYAESSCAALVVASISSFGLNHEFTAMLYPLIVSSMGILICLLTTFFATDFPEIKSVNAIEHSLTNQLSFSTAFMMIGIAIATWVALPSSFTIFNFGEQKVVESWLIFACGVVGLCAGFVIRLVNEYYTSNAYSDNAAGIADMAGMSHRIRERTDSPDAAGYAAIGKFWVLSLISFCSNILVHKSFCQTYRISCIMFQGFAICSAALVSLALFGAFVSRVNIFPIDVLTPKVFIGLLVGAIIPYWFSAMTMKSVGSAALKMVEEVRRQFNTIPGLLEGTGKPDYAACIKISTNALSER